MLIFVSPTTRHSLGRYPRCLPCSCPAMPAAGYGQGWRAHRSCRCACGHSSGSATRCSDHDGDHSSRAGLVKAKAQQLAEGSSGSSSLATDLCLANQLWSVPQRPPRSWTRRVHSSCGYRHANAVAPATAYCRRQAGTATCPTTDMVAATAPAAVATPARRGGRRGHSYAAVHSMRHAPRIVDNAMQLPATTRTFHHSDPDTAEAVPHSQQQAQEHSCAL